MEKWIKKFTKRGLLQCQIGAYILQFLELLLYELWNLFKINHQWLVKLNHLSRYGG
jgi:hypothetical protein